MLNGSCRIVEETEQKLTLGFFPNYHAFHLVQVREGADDVAAAASAVLGRSVTIECVEIDDRARRGPVAGRAASGCGVRPCGADPGRARASAGAGGRAGGQSRARTCTRTRAHTVL